MTRAKSSLYIHCNNDIFNGISAVGIKQVTDPVNYGEPSELLVQLTHRDVYLDFFKNKQSVINRLRSSNTLFLNKGYLCTQINGQLAPVVGFSKAFREQLSRWSAKGDYPISSEIQFIVAWKHQADDKETLIVLPSIKLRKK